MDLLDRTDHRAARRADQEESVAALVSKASRQLTQLVHDELRLAQAEMAQKGRRWGVGGGLLGGAGIVAMLALQALVATAIIALALVLPLWAAALVIAAALLLIAAVLGGLGKRKVGQAGPPVPEQAIESVRADLVEIKERAHR
ncbi:phage holin family protein [Streptomyces sp. NPDC006326]|uniref:phage holin family protein n=1 Tax=Streptomyces sp. NPDC006326 TaxID=3156752 RepID=UPI0033A4C0DE